MADYECRILDDGSDVVVLDLAEADGYVIRGISMPEMVRRRDVATSPDMDGEVERESVLDAAVLELVVSCRGVDADDAWDLYDALYDAVNGATRAFTVETTMHGRVELWDARRAIAWRLDTDKARMVLHHRDVSLMLPVHPVPTVGGS